MAEHGENPNSPESPKGKTRWPLLSNLWRNIEWVLGGATIVTFVGAFHPSYTVLGGTDFLPIPGVEVVLDPNYLIAAGVLATLFAAARWTKAIRQRVS